MIVNCRRVYSVALRSEIPLLHLRPTVIIFEGIYYPAVRTGSSNTRPDGGVLVIPIFSPWFFTPPSGRGLVKPVFFLPRRQDGV